MSDVVKWAILVALVLVIFVMIVSLPVFIGFNIPALVEGISGFISVAGTTISNARAIINNFLTPTAREVLSGLIFYLVAKPFVLFAIDLTVGITRFVYK